MMRTRISTRYLKPMCATPASHLWKHWMIIPLLAVLLLAGLGLKGATAEAAGTTAPLASCAGTQYSDVCPDDWFYPYVTSLNEIGALSGYADGTFRPYNAMTRGQIMKTIVIATGLNGSVPSTPTFADVPVTHPFYNWIAIGVANNVVSGYQCGGSGEPCDGANRPYFRPNANVNRGQFAKMIANANNWSDGMPSSRTFADVPTTSPYYQFVERAAANNAISGYTCGGPGEPCDGRSRPYFRPGSSVTRAQASKMIDLARRGGVPPTPQPTQPPPPPPPGGGATIGGCPLFPADNIWNRAVTTLPVHPNSAGYINSIGGGASLHPDFAAGSWNGAPIGIPVNVVPATQPLVPLNLGQWAGVSDPGPYPIPPNAAIEGGSGDRHVLVVQSGTCLAVELYHADPVGGGAWNADTAARWSLTSNALRPNGWSSADAAGLPILSGLVYYDEVATGAIHHAIRFTTANIGQSYVWPARHSDGDSTDPNIPPMGTRLRLKASVDISGFDSKTQVILRALQTYGMILADTGGELNISGAPDSRWNDELLNAMEAVHASDFEAVDTSSLMIDPNSGQSR
jgi:S-layer homology domain